MKSKALALVVLLGMSAVGCGGAVDANDGSDVTPDETAKVGESDQALSIGTSVGTGSTTSIQTCVEKQSCHFECTDPVDENDIFHCKLVCVTVCSPL